MSLTTEFFLPQLPRLLPYAYHPNATRIEFASNGWVRRMLGDCFISESELLRFLRERNGLYGSLTVPRASEQRTQDVADWYQYVTLIDTVMAQINNPHELFSTIVNGFNADEIDDPRSYIKAANELWRRISPGLSKAQLARFLASLEVFLKGCTSEMDVQQGQSMDVFDYEACMALRRDSFGCDFIELLAEYGAEVDMSDCLEQMVEVHLHCRRQMILVNDLLSWRKERLHDEKINLVRILIELEGYDLQGAVNRLVALVEYHERAYIAARDELLSGLLGKRDDVRKYLLFLDHLMGGTQEFEYLTPRYFGDGSVWDGSTFGWVDLEAAVTRFREQPSAC
ncbi:MULTISPECIES: terpene synthase family protein [Pseudomonas]|uniref:terpene synthase family protein n=1 Tax=Pseudomonas TaxID=286 RepID=UPI0006B5092D|nr:terpene synthase family protein [Pseudomonas fuscovaginae]KPA97847.1 glycyl-tRNA synthetase beta chain [Pseudomonas fuscovaginae]